MKSKFMTATTAGRPSTVPRAASSASTVLVRALRVLQAVGVLLLVAEAERVDRRLGHLQPGPAALVEERPEPVLGTDPHVEAAVRADPLVLVEVAVEDHPLAGRALVPEILRHLRLARAGGVEGPDLRADVVGEPAHGCAPGKSLRKPPSSTTAPTQHDAELDRDPLLEELKVRLGRELGEVDLPRLTKHLGDTLGLRLREPEVLQALRRPEGVEQGRAHPRASRTPPARSRTSPWTASVQARPRPALLVEVACHAGRPGPSRPRRRRRCGRCSAACCGSRMPKPTATGRSVCRFRRATSGATWSATAVLTPVMPVSET